MAGTETSKGIDIPLAKDVKAKTDTFREKQEKKLDPYKQAELQVTREIESMELELNEAMMKAIENGEYSAFVPLRFFLNNTDLIGLLLYSSRNDERGLILKTINNLKSDLLSTKPDLSKIRLEKLKAFIEGLKSKGYFVNFGSLDTDLNDKNSDSNKLKSQFIIKVDWSGKKYHQPEAIVLPN